MCDFENVVVGDRAFRILMFLAGESGVGGEVFDNKASALTVADIAVMSLDERLMIESTVYKNLQVLLAYDFVKQGIPNDRRNTYYISKEGKEYLESCCR